MATPVNLVADIGGTNARFAFVEEGSVTLQGIEVFPCADFPLLVDAIKVYIAQRQRLDVTRVCLAIAGNVEEDWVDMLNNHWAFSQLQLQEELKLPILFVNDFTAQVLSLAHLAGDELHWLCDHRPQGGQVQAVLGPGTGLGVSALTPGGDILPSEGGHANFSPVDAHEAELLEVLWTRFSRVSIERVLSGMGLANLYWANCRLGGLHRELPAADITAGARAGDEYCSRAVRDFQGILGSVAGDIALTVGALDGVYLSGGILPKMMDLLDAQLIWTRFQEKGRQQPMLARTPLAIVLAEHPGLLGCVEALKRLG